MSGLTTHAACGKTWKQRGNRTGHCSGCHETFEGVSLFDLHRRGGVCADPREMDSPKSVPLVFDGTYGDGAWNTKAGFERLRIQEGTRGTGNPFKAAIHDARDRGEVVLTVGAHDPIVMQGMGAVWVECECSWIGPSCYTEDAALKSHAKHVEKVTA